MNEFTRVGKGDVYVEVSMDWMSGSESEVAWMFRECVTDDPSGSLWKKAVIEAFEITKEDLK
jgi:hypothetical protein